MFRQETRALDGLRIAGWIRSLPRSVPYLSTHGCRTVCLRGFGGRVFSGSEMQRCTNTEPGAVATGYSVDYEPRCFVRRLAHWTVCVLQVAAGRCRSRFRICRPTAAGLFAYAALAVVFLAEARCSDAQIRNREQFYERAVKKKVSPKPPKALGS